jgi:Spy/CpxP family protein refolding chaperone
MFEYKSFAPTAFVLLTLAGLCSLPARSQPPDEHRHSGGRLERLTQELSLTPDQVTQLKAAFESMRQHGHGPSTSGSSSASGSTEASHGDHPHGPPPDRAAMDAKLKAILTPEQWTKFEQIKASHHHGPPRD